MSVRSQALDWYKDIYKKIDSPIYTSKFYKPEESWPKKSVWWFHIPIKIIKENISADIRMLCQIAPNRSDFHFLKVPAKFLHEHLDDFYILHDNISLYLSIPPKSLFIEERGKGNLSFKNFF